MNIEQNDEELTPQQSLQIIGKMLDKVKDDALLKVAKKRAAFKLTLAIYCVINIFLTGLWYVTTGINSYFWPLWPMLAWGLGIIFQYFDAYLISSYGAFSEEREFEKMKKKIKAKEDNSS